jgi:hypothetical protein
VGGAVGANVQTRLAESDLSVAGGIDEAHTSGAQELLGSPAQPVGHDEQRSICRWQRSDCPWCGGAEELQLDFGCLTRRSCESNAGAGRRAPGQTDGPIVGEPLAQPIYYLVLPARSDHVDENTYVVQQSKLFVTGNCVIWSEH